MHDSIPLIPVPQMQDPFLYVQPIGGLHAAQILPEILGLHRHDCYEIFWIADGAGSIQIDFQHYPYTRQSLLLIAPGQVHGWATGNFQPDSQGWVLVFSLDFLPAAAWQPFSRQELAGLGWIDQNPYYKVKSEQAEMVTYLFRMLEREHAEARRERQAALQSWLQLLLIEIGRMAPDVQRPHREEAAFRLAKQFLAAVEREFASDAGVADYAAMLHVSRNHFIEAVTRSLGQSPGEVLQARRLLEAKRLLRYSDTSVHDIALQIGYRDPSYFGRLFKQRTGLSPSQFRRQ